MQESASCQRALPAQSAQQAQGCYSFGRIPQRVRCPLPEGIQDSQACRLQLRGYTQVHCVPRVLDAAEDGTGDHGCRARRGTPFRKEQRRLVRSRGRRSVAAGPGGRRGSTLVGPRKPPHHGVACRTDAARRWRRRSSFGPGRWPPIGSGATSDTRRGRAGRDPLTASRPIRTGAPPHTPP